MGIQLGDSGRGMYLPSIELDDNLARAVVVNLFELSYVS